MRIGAMVWRTGELLDLYEQIAWFRQQRFEGIAFHTAPSLTGTWASFDVSKASLDDRQRLKKALDGFHEVSVHAPFEIWDICLCSPNELVRRASVESLRTSIELAHELGAQVVTVHEGFTYTEVTNEVRRTALACSIAELGSMTKEMGVVVGFELVRDYDLVLEAKGSVGITIDIGHLYPNNGAGYRYFGTVGNLIRHLGRKVVHVHVHDYDGKNDHLAIGAGCINFEDALTALYNIGYSGMLCLELNPEHTTPEDYLRSREVLERILISQMSQGSASTHHPTTNNF